MRRERRRGTRIDGVASSRTRVVEDARERETSSDARASLDAKRRSLVDGAAARASDG